MTTFAWLAAGMGVLIALAWSSWHLMRTRRRPDPEHLVRDDAHANAVRADDNAEVDLLKNRFAAKAPVVLATHWGEGGKGAAELARTVVELIEKGPSNFKFVYDEAQPLWNKIQAIATKIYGAKEVTADAKVRHQIKALQDAGYGHYPVCVAKTQYSFSTDPGAKAAP